MSRWRMLLGLAALMTLPTVVHPASVLAFLIDVRSGPGVAYEVVATIPPVGSIVAVAQEQEWYKIQLPDGRQGWIHSTAVQPEPPPRTPPVLAPTPTAVALPPSAPPLAVTPSRPSEPVTTPPMSRRTALVLGNAAYPVGPLRNAGKDATAIAASLRRLGFDVTVLRDVSLQEMEEAVHAFNGRLRQGGMGFFYFAGHGVQVDGENYLIPLNARIDRQQDVRYQALPMGRVVGAMEEAGNGLNILILDTCRNMSFTRSWRSSQAGLAAPRTARGILIAYATAPGGEAEDGDGEHGVYTKHLLQAMLTPGLSIEEVFKQVRYGVIAETRGRQIPWESSSLLGDVAFVPAHADPMPAVLPPYPSAAADPETVMWSISERSSQPEDVLAFLQTYPGSRFAPAARLRLQQLQGQRPPTGSGPAPEPPGVVPPPSAEGSPPSLSPNAPPAPPSDRVVPPTVSAVATSREDAGSPTPIASPSSPRASPSYTLIRRIYCEDVRSGVIQSSMDLMVTSYVSCAEAHKVLLDLEQQRDNCRFPNEDPSFVDTTARESPHKAKEWVETASCKIPS